jgi:hypothetical protein
VPIPGEELKQVAQQPLDSWEHGCPSPGLGMTSGHLCGSGAAQYHLPWSSSRLGEDGWGLCTRCGKDPLHVPPLFLQGFQVAYVVFQKPGGVSAALTLKGPLLVSTENHPVKTGIYSQYYCSVWHLLSGPWVGEGTFLGTASVNATSLVPSP